ncbi:hypothetical protein CFI11_00720 [Thalassococcus sp. S3]|nr:hypothetical protein CFI11_00720 [Thalassococcus sp. S3]
MKPLDLIKTARRLAGPTSSRKPRQSDLKRAVSSAYYAMFHTLCQNCADCLIGTAGSARSAPAWRQAYRSVDHGYAKKQCGNKTVTPKFPKDIEDFANLFRTLQEERHLADYDPSSRFTRTETIEHIDAAETAIKDFRSAPISDRRAFAAWTAMQLRKS